MLSLITSCRAQPWWKTSTLFCECISTLLTSYDLNTPFNNPIVRNVAEIEVTDPTHPLFGRCFSVLSVSSSGRASASILVSYRQCMVLRIPLSATNLIGSRPIQQSKLTLGALAELKSLAEHWEGNSCHANQRSSGAVCPQSYKLKSSTSSRRSYRR